MQQIYKHNNKSELFHYFINRMVFIFVKDTEEVEVLLGYSARLLQRFGYPWESLSLMYVILKDSRADVEVAMRRITKGNGFNEIFCPYCSFYC
jgi:hypothetical protein